MEFETLDVSTRRHLDRDDEGAEHIRAVTSEQVRLRHRDDKIRFPELPVAGPPRRRRKVVHIALGRAELDPLLNELDLSIAQSPLAGKLSIARFGFPGRHRSALGHRRDQMRAPAHIVIRQQTEGRGLTRPMT